MIIGSSPMDNPAMFFGNPHPSSRVLKQGDFINNELAFGYRGYTAQIGSPICLGQATDEIQDMWENITLPVFKKLEAIMKPGTSYHEFQKAGQWVREQGFQSRPTVLHSIDYVTSQPYVWVEETAVYEGETHFEPNMTVMLEPNPISADGNLGLFLGRTYIITEDGNEAVTKFPLELTVI